MLVGIGALFESIVMSKSTGKKELPMSSADQTRNKTWRLSPDLLGFVNLDGVFFDTNPAWQTVLGWSEEEIRSKTFIDFLHPDDIDRSVAIFEHMKQGGSALHFENRFQCKDGSYRWQSWVGVQGGDIFFCSARDITHNKEQSDMLKTSQDALKASEQRLRLALDIAGIGIWEWDMVSDEVAWDQRQFELFGLPEVEGNIPLSATIDVIHPDDREMLNETAKKVFEGGGSALNEFRVVRPDGSIRWLLGRSNIIEFDESAKSGLLVGVNMDITAAKEAEHALRKSRNDLASGNKEKDRRAENLIAANKELEFQSIEKDKRADELFLANVEKDRRAEELIVANKEKDKREVELVLANKEKDKRAEELFLANIEKDRRADELTLANQNLVIRTEQLAKAQKMEAIGRLTAGIAHDFNNLLAVILWNVELAELGQPSSAETVEHLAIKQAINSGSEMTQRLVASSTMTALASQPTDIADLIRNKIGVYTLLLGETIDFTFNVEPELWPALVDENRFDDAIYNLIANAKDAMPHGGTLSVTAENVIIDEKKATSLGNISAGMFVLVTVSDNGCGIEPEFLNTVFDPFYTTKQFGESNGLGLSMVHGFARQTGGHVLIESEPSISTSVKLYLPRASALATFAPEAEAEAEAEAEVVMPNQYIGSRILVVEDNPEVLSACQRALETEGFQVVTALNGRDAIARLSEELPFDLLFSDIVLPGDMSGIDVQREAHLLQPTIKSILTTGYASLGVVNRLDAKDSDILHKPYSRKDLLDRIEAALAS
jgi:PAS domain S-box-containing protein